MTFIKSILFFLIFLGVLHPDTVLASSELTMPSVDLSGSTYGIMALVVFCSAYAFVPFESTIHLRKSKPVMFAAGVIWILVSIAAGHVGESHVVENAIKHSLQEYGELFLFLLAAMTYINSLEERNVFETLRVFLVSRRMSYRKIFWVTGILSFLLSPIADNLTTALLMGAVVMAVGRTDRKFVTLGCINVVVAANAGGAFSPFGDITTLMVWQEGKVGFTQFFAIFFPSLINWLIPAAFLSVSVSSTVPDIPSQGYAQMKYGAKVMIGLFLLTIMTAVSFHNFLHLPPAAGMMLGLSFLGIFSYHVKRHEGRSGNFDAMLGIMMRGSRQPDLTKVKAHREAVAQAVDNLRFPAFAIDRDHIVTHWNKPLEELSGRKAEEMIGTDNHWEPFYNERRKVMADLVMEESGLDEFQMYYPGRVRKRRDLDDGYTAIGYFPKLSKTGKWLVLTASPISDEKGEIHGAVETIREIEQRQREESHFDVMRTIAGAEWDTLLFFYGVILCVGGLSQFGYLTMLSEFMYSDLGPTYANVLVGVLSAIVDNIPVMFAVLTMDPQMDLQQWLLVTLTAGVGGSMLAVGSAAGVALMGTARGIYTFGAHLRWTPIIALGYAASIFCHFLIN